MNDDRARDAVTRDKIGKRASRAGYRVPPEFRGAPAVVTWRVRGCRCLVLSVYLTPDGWGLSGRSFTVPMPEWIERSNHGDLTLESYRAGRWAAPSAGKVRGHVGTLPLDVDAWDEATRFELGCPHGHGYWPLSDLAADCRQMLATRTEVTRAVAWDR